MLKSQFARLAFKKTVFDDYANLAMIISALNEHSEFDPLLTRVGVMKDESQTWRQMSLLLIEEANG